MTATGEALETTIAPARASDSRAAAPNRWHAGTLTYSTAGLVVLFFWLLWGDFVFSFKESAVPPMLQVLLKRFDASDFVVGALIGTLPQLMSALLSPVISYRSDRHRGRFGRRIPYLFIPTPIAVVSMMGLAYSPPIGRWISHLINRAWLGEHAAVIGSFALFWMLFEFSSITCMSVISGLINDVVPRQVLGRFFGLFRMFSLAPGMAFSWWLLGKAETHYAQIFLAIGALYGIAFTAMCLRVREGEYPPPPPQPSRGRVALVGAVRSYTQECFSNSYYRWYFASLALINMGFQAIILFYLYFAQSVGLDLDTLGKYFAIQLFFSWCLALPIGWLCDKIHPLRVTIIALALYAAATLASFFLIRGAFSCGIAQIVCGCIAGCWNTATSPLGPALLPKMKFATFTSAAAVVSAAGVMTISPVYGRFMDLVHHDYRYIFLFAFAFTVLSLLATLKVYGRFMEYGGPAQYVAPV